MTELLERAVSLLHSRQVSCVVLKDGEEPYLSSDIGIKPLMIRLREDKKAFEKAAVADKIVGKAAAMMAVYGGALAVYGEVMSEAAEAFLKGQHVECCFFTKVPYIENRTRTGRCPMEETVMDIEDMPTAFDALEAAIARLMEGRKN